MGWREVFLYTIAILIARYESAISPYCLSPSNRTVLPAEILTGKDYSVDNTDGLFPITLLGVGSYFVLDFGKEVSGYTTISFNLNTTDLWDTDDVAPSIGLTFSESSNYAYCPPSAPPVPGDTSDLFFCDTVEGDPEQAGSGDRSNGGSGPDGPILSGNLNEIVGNEFIPPESLMRGGFRYINIYLNSGSSVVISQVTVTFLPSPRMEDPSDYDGSFQTDQPLINKIWYGSAYTIQLCTVDPNMGRVWPPPATQWDNNCLVGVDSVADDDGGVGGDDSSIINNPSILVDGAKRDRTIWPGDMGIASLSSYITIGDTFSPKQSLSTLYEHQDQDSGMLPWVGPAVFCQEPEGVSCKDTSGSYPSDTYHLWTLIATYDYYTYLNGDIEFVETYWEQFQLGLNCSIAKMNGDHGLMYVTATADWARNNQGGENIAANALLVAALEGGANLASVLGRNDLTSYYDGLASQIKQTLMDVLFDDESGAFRDNPNEPACSAGGICPQDGNSIAMWRGVVSSDIGSRISTYLTSNWNEFGSTTPEWNNNIATFSGSIEVIGHAAIGEIQTSLDLMSLSWGYMLESSNSTNSTFWEGYLENGQFGYQGNYMSHSHGWATGPAVALSNYLLGIKPMVIKKKGKEEKRSEQHQNHSPMFKSSSENPLLEEEASTKPASSFLFAPMLNHGSPRVPQINHCSGSMKINQLIVSAEWTRFTLMEEKENSPAILSSFPSLAASVPLSFQNQFCSSLTCLPLFHTMLTTTPHQNANHKNGMVIAEMIIPVSNSFLMFPKDSADLFVFINGVEVWRRTRSDEISDEPVEKAGSLFRSSQVTFTTVPSYIDDFLSFEMKYIPESTINIVVIAVV